MKKRTAVRAAVGAGAAALAAVALAVPLLASADTGSGSGAGSGTGGDDHDPADPETYVAEVVELTNEQRMEHGCGELRLDDDLLVPAQEHSQDMADNDYMDHVGSDGREPGDRVEDSEYPGSYGAENVAAGYETPEDVVDGWMNSDGHRENILNCELTAIGVGYAENENSQYELYWTQLFGVD
ncbi:MAG: CAP domain-containing protein [Stackebrandtia sp.]